jgi:hypothetical protein
VDLIHAGGELPRLLQQRGAEVHQVNPAEHVEPLAEEQQVTPGAAAEFDHAGAIQRTAGLGQRRDEAIDHLSAAVQQALAEGVVLARLGTIEGGQALRVGAAARLSAQHGPEHTNVAG